MKIALIPCGLTDWHGSGRLLGRVEVPLSDQGRSRLKEWVAAIEAIHPARILHSSDELCSETARGLGQAMNVPVKAVSGLDEVDVGLWAGLTDEQLESRYTSAFRELQDAPLSVSPPEGEPLAEAADRLRRSMRDKISRNGESSLAFVLRPLVLALARCELEGRPRSQVWDLAHETDGPVVVDYQAHAPRGRRKKAS